VWNKLLTKAIVQDFLENVIADALEGSEDKWMWAEEKIVDAGDGESEPENTSQHDNIVALNKNAAHHSWQKVMHFVIKRLIQMFPSINHAPQYSARKMRKTYVGIMPILVETHCTCSVLYFCCLRDKIDFCSPYHCWFLNTAEQGNLSDQCLMLSPLVCELLFCWRYRPCSLVRRHDSHTPETLWHGTLIRYLAGTRPGWITN
jgi:hypothetical protein